MAKDSNDTLRAVLAGGAMLIAAAFVLGHQISTWRLAPPVVTVRGAAELPVQADLATWTLGVSSSNDDLRVAQGEITRSLGLIRQFLIGHGLKDDEIEMQSLSVNDAKANQYNQANGPRFTVAGGLLVRTGNLDGVRQAKNALNELVGQGVILTNSYGPNYAFTKLSDAKPDLTSKATAEARKAAEQFAKDSGEGLGAIRSARQGSVEILGRDGNMGESEQVNKTLRVVTTVDYELR